MDYAANRETLGGLSQLFRDLTSNFSTLVLLGVDVEVKLSCQKFGALCIE